ncbi:hypothetical protein [Exilibacterium tricleocarpae]|nr:hypothetical protein [Exilibacterium tricleocarpae]
MIERIVFENTMRGATVTEAMEINHHNFDSDGICGQNNVGELELFYH